jgi:hypothetical protein
MKINIDSHAKGLHNLLRILTYLLALPIACFLSAFCLITFVAGLLHLSPFGIVWGFSGLCGTYGLFLAAAGIRPARAALCMLAGMVAMLPLVLSTELRTQWIAAPFWIALLHQIVFAIRFLRRRTA